MKKEAKKNIYQTQTKMENAIGKKIDEWIDKSVDKTLEEIDKEDKQIKSNKTNEKKAKHNQNEKLIFGMSYFLFFIALIFSKSEHKNFYANQGLVLFLFTLLGGVVFRFGLAFIHYETSIIASLVFYVLMFFCAFYGFIKTIRGEQFVKIPFIGKITILK